ncbi:MAG: 3-dehydroquinate synthase, partial [Rhizomicrobium sp.]
AGALRGKMTEIIKIGLGLREYSVHVGHGLLEQAGKLLEPYARGQVPVVTDATVGEMHLADLLDSCGRAGIDARPIVMAPGEASKSFAGLESLCGQLLNLGVDRGGLILALGGGVIGDLAGFAAGILKRGVAIAQIPTTLLAQVDSSVGGKTAINTAQGKNLLGLFHQPSIVVADTGLLSTLPRRELAAGYAEVIKYGALGDSRFFAWLEAHGAEALGGGEPALTHAVAHCVAMKAAIVARDERETGERALLNLGHTFGHALEAATGFSSRLLHGEAVAIGMVLAFRLSGHLSLCPPADAERLARHLKSAGLPSAISDIPGRRLEVQALLAAMRHDKKAKDGALVFVLARGLGKAFIARDVPLDAVKDVLSA